MAGGKGKGYISS